MAESVGSLEATFTLNLTPLQRGLRQASSMLQAWAKKHEDDTEAEVGVDISPLQAGLRDASRALERFDGSTATAKVELDGERQFTKQLQSAYRSLSAVDGREATAKVELEGVPQFTRQAQSAFRALSQVDGREAVARVRLDGVQTFTRQLQSAFRSLSAVDGKEATANVTADTTRAENVFDRFRATLANVSRSGAVVSLSADDRKARERVQQFVSWLKQQRAELTISAVTGEAQQAAEAAKAYIGSLNANIDVGANTAAAIAEGRLAAGRINQMSPQFDVGAQTSGAMGDVHGVVNRIGGMRGNVQVGANTQPAESELAGFNQTIRRYSRSWGQQGIRARVMADTRQAQAQVRNLEQILDRTTQGEHRVRVEAETQRARGQLRGLQQIATGLGMQDPTVSVGVRGVAASTAQMLGLWKLADRLDGYNVQFSASVDQTISKVLPQALGALEQQVARFRSIATATAAVSVPALQTAIASLPGVLSMAATSAGALATRLGAGLVGAIGSVGSAAALGGAALGTYGYAMGRTLNYAFNLSSMLGDQKSKIDDAADAVKVAKAAVASATPGTQQYTNAVRGLAFAEQNAAFETRKMNAMMGFATPATLKLNDAANSLQIEFIKLGSAMTNAQAPMLTRWISGLTGVMQNSRGAIVGMVTDMNKVVDSFVRTMSRGREMANLSNIFSGIRAAGVPTMQILTSAIRLFVNTFAATVPTGLKVLNVLSRVTMAAARWSGTAAGQSKIRTVWQSLAAAGAQLWRIVRDLSIGLGGVIIALNQTGIGQSMMNGLEGIASAFRNVMRAGGAGRAAIVEMGHATRPTLSALADLVGYLGRQFGQMAMEVAKSQVITDTVKAIHTALKGTETSMGIIPMLRHEFEVIGPLLPPLIKALGLWFSTFAYAQPEMVLFIKTITRVLEAFNSLPQPVQRTVARMLAWGSVIQMLGGTALVGLIAKIFLFRRAMATMRAVQAANGAAMATQSGIFSRMGTAIRGAAAATWTYTRAATVAAARSTAAGVAAAASAIKVRVLSVATRAAAVGMRAMGVAATFMLGPWGLVIAGVIALGAALVIAYRRSETFRNAVNAVGNFIKTTAVAAFRGLVNAARSVWQWFKRLPAPIQMLISPIGALVANFGRIRNAIGGVVRVIGNFGRIIGGVLTGNTNQARAALSRLPAPLQGIGRALGMATARVRVFVHQAIFWLRAQGMRFMAWWRQVWPMLSKVWGRVFTYMINRARAAWNVIRTVVGTGVRATVAIVRAVWGQLTRFWANNGKRFAQSARATWRIIRTIIGGTIKQIGNVIKLGLQVITGDWKGAGNTLKRMWRVSWNAIKTITKSAWTILKNLVKIGISAIGQLLKVNTKIWGRIFKALWNGIKAGARAFWNALKSLWNRSLTAIGNRTEVWRDALRNLMNRIAGWVRDRWNAFWNGIKSLWNRSLTAVGNRTESWRDALRALMDRIAKWVRNRWNSFWGGLKGLWDRSLRAVGNRTESWRDALRNLFDRIAKWARSRWDSFWSGMRGLWDRALSAIGDRARSWGNAIKNLFQRVKGWMTNPIEAARDTLKSVWNSILSGIGRVAKAVGLDKIAEGVNGAKWAKGGTTEGGGGQAFANGGTTLRKFAAGGMGTSTRQPRMHLWNEQMGNEAYITERGDPRKQTKYLRTAASWHGMDVVPSGSRQPDKQVERDVAGIPRSQRPPGFAKGGIAEAARAFAAGGFAAHVAQANQEIASKFNLVRPPATYAGHGKYGAPYAADYWVTGYGNKAAGAQKATGDRIASHIEQNGGRLSAESMIWYDQTITGSGRGSYNENNPYYRLRGMNLPYNTRAHFDHVHTQYTKSGKKGSGGLMSSGGGGFLASLWDTVGNAIWNRLVSKPYENKVEEPLKGGFVGKQMVAGAGRKLVLDPLKEHFISEAGSSGASGKGSPEQVKKWVRQGLPMGGAFPATSSNVDKMAGRAMQESTGDPNAINRWDANWLRGTPSKGLFQIIEPTWNSHSGGIGSFDANWNDPVKSTAVASRYMKSRYGRIMGASGSGYARGGVIPGLPGAPKSILAHAGERILPRDLNTGFESLSRSIDSWNSRGASAPSVDVGGNDVSRLEAKLDALMERLDEGLDVYERNWSEGEKTMIASQKSKAGKEVQRQNAEEEANRKLARRR